MDRLTENLFSYGLGLIAVLGVLQIIPPVIRLYLRRPGAKKFKVFLVWLAFIALFFRIFARCNIRTDDGIILAGSLRTNTLLKCVYLTGCYEPTLAAYLKRRMRPGDLFLDIGANSGHFSLLAAKLGSEVISVEASPANCRLFSANVAANDLGSKIRLVEAAAGDKDGQIELQENWFNGMFSTTCSQPFWYLRPFAKKITVPEVKVDDLVAEAGSERIRFVKIDVEGAELTVLHGLNNLIGSGGAEMEFCLEFSPSWMTSEQAREIFSIFRENGYNAYTLENREVDFPPYEIAIPEVCSEIPGRQVDLIFSRSDPATVCATTT